MPYKMVLLDKEDGIAVITLNRPEKRNAFNMEMMAEIDMAFEEAARDKEIKAIILTGAGKAFSAGLDFNWAATMDTQNLPPMASPVRGREVNHHRPAQDTEYAKAGDSGNQRHHIGRSIYSCYSL